MRMVRIFFVIVASMILLNVGKAGALQDVEKFKRVEIQHDALKFTIYYLYRQEQKGEIISITPNSTLREGDLYKVIFRPATDGYVYIFQTDVSGRIKQLFPEIGVERHEGKAVFNAINPFVQGGKQYDVPAGNDPFGFRNTYPLVDHIYFLAFPQRNQELEDAYWLMGQKLQENLLRGDVAQEVLLSTLQNSCISDIAPLLVKDVEKEIIPDTPAEILKALGIPLLPYSSKPGTKGLSGIPDEALLAKLPKVGLVNLFKNRATTIVPEAYPLLDEFGQVLRGKLKDIVLVIAAYTDHSGSESEDMDLSARRAQAVKQFFMTQCQIAEHRLLTKPYGGSKLGAVNSAVTKRKLTNLIELIRIE
jgi:flagellar motor protein MotB